MVVYLVMRGRELHNVCATESLATQLAGKLNDLFPRGTRYRVASITVMEG